MTGLWLLVLLGCITERELAAELPPLYCDYVFDCYAHHDHACDASTCAWQTRSECRTEIRADVEWALCGPGSEVDLDLAQGCLDALAWDLCPDVLTFPSPCADLCRRKDAL